LHPHLLKATAMANHNNDPAAEQPGDEAEGSKLLDPVSVNKQAAAVLAGLDLWLPKDLVAAAEAAAAAATAAAALAAPQQGPSAADNADGKAVAGKAADIAAATAMADSAAAAVLVDVRSSSSGDSVWLDEARLVGSVMGLAKELEGVWTALMEELELTKVR
jgi:hypothetical protein